METIVGGMSDVLLFRKLYARIFSQQIRDENRLAQLIMIQGNNVGSDQAASEAEFLTVLRNKVELDRRIVYKLGEQVAALERNEGVKKGRVQTIPQSKYVQFSQNPAKEKYHVKVAAQNAGMNNLAPFLDSLATELGLAHNATRTPQMSPQPNIKVHPPHKLNDDQSRRSSDLVVDPKDVEIIFNDDQTTFKTAGRPVTQSQTADHHNTTGALQVPPTNYAKKVSFNEVPRVIIAPQDPWTAGAQHQNKPDIRPMNVEGTVTQRGYHGNNATSERRVVEVEAKSQQLPTYPHVSQHANRIPTQEHRHQAIYNTYPQEAVRHSFDLRNIYDNRQKRITANKQQVERPTGNNLPQAANRVVTSSTVPHADHVNKTNVNNKDMFALLDQMFEAIHPEFATEKNNQGVNRNMATSLTSKTERDRPKDSNLEELNDLIMEKMFKPKIRYCTKFDEWLESHEQEEFNKQHHKINTKEQLYQEIARKRQQEENCHFYNNNVLLSMRRKSWVDTGCLRNTGNPPTRLGSMFQRMRRKSSFSAAPSSTSMMVIKADKGDFHVKKSVRRRMSVRPLPEAPTGPFDRILDTINEI